MSTEGHKAFDTVLLIACIVVIVMVILCNNATVLAIGAILAVIIGTALLTLIQNENNKESNESALKDMYRRGYEDACKEHGVGFNESQGT